jgi:hypothetical protein
MLLADDAPNMGNFGPEAKQKIALEPDIRAGA